MKRFEPQNLKWYDIKIKIEVKIILSEFKSGQKLPSIEDIAREYEVAKITAINALKMLDKEGIIMNKGTAGYYVKPLISTTLKKKHISELIKEAEKIAAHAKTIKADYDDIKPICDLFNELLNSIESEQPGEIVKLDEITYNKKQKQKA